MKQTGWQHPERRLITLLMLDHTRTNLTTDHFDAYSFNTGVGLQSAHEFDNS